MVAYEEVRKQVLIFNTMFAVTCAVLAFITMAANCPYFVEPARAELSETSKILGKYQKPKKLELCFWKNILKNQDFEKSQKKLLQIQRKPNANQLKSNANHHITHKVSQNRTSKRHNFFNFQYFPMI